MIPKILERGTPSSICEAIMNGLQISKWQSNRLAQDIVREHVKDFLAQKFGVAMMSEDPKAVEAATELWNAIFPEDRRTP